MGIINIPKEEIIELAQNWFDKHGRLVQRDLKTC